MPTLRPHRTATVTTKQNRFRFHIRPLPRPSGAFFFARRPTYHMTDDPAYSPLFRAAMTHVLASEAGRSNHPKDPGGKTNRGITQRTYDAWNRAHKVPGKLDVYNITEDEVLAIYFNAYARPVRFEELPAGVGYCVLDEAIISGPMRAALHLQEAVRVKQDGNIGILTVHAASIIPDAILIDRLCDERLSFERKLKAWVTFGKGWTNRVEAVRRAAMIMTTPTISQHSELSRLG